MLEEQLSKELEDAKRLLQEVEGRKQRIKELKTIEALADALNTLHEYRSHVQQISESEDAIVRAVNDLIIKVEAEVAARQAHRERENETLSKLDKYLEEWL